MVSFYQQKQCVMISPPLAYPLRPLVLRHLATTRGGPPATSPSAITGSRIPCVSGRSIEMAPGALWLPTTMFCHCGDTAQVGRMMTSSYLSRLPWIFWGFPLKVSGAPTNTLYTALLDSSVSWYRHAFYNACLLLGELTVTMLHITGHFYKGLTMCSFDVFFVVAAYNGQTFKKTVKLVVAIKPMWRNGNEDNCKCFS